MTKNEYRKNRRTDVNWSRHEHSTKIFKCGDEEIRVDILKRPDTICGMVKFTNTSDTLTVSGDYGNWVFCRPFHPSKNGYVSDHYWVEKLKICSQQRFDNEIDFKETIKEINNLREECSSEEEILWLDELESICANEDFVEYLHKAFREYPKDFEHEYIPIAYKTPVWLPIIFDAFNEMCCRIHDKE